MAKNKKMTPNDVTKFLDDLPEKTVVMSSDGNYVARRVGGEEYPWYMLGVDTPLSTHGLMLWSNEPWKVLVPAPVEIAADETVSILGEGIHTGLRKGTDAPEAHDLWMAISNSDNAWSDALGYAVWGLGYMGLALVRKEK